jgi:hypothetical protein
LMSMVTSGASPEPFTVLPNKVPDNLTCMAGDTKGCHQNR